MVMLDILHVSSIASARLSNVAANDTISPALSPSLSTQTLSTQTLSSETLGIQTLSNQPLSPQMWHVAVTRPGMFPMPEARCPCEKAPCGLVIPRAEVECEVHNAYAALHQVHPGEDCRSVRASGRRTRPRRRGPFWRS